MNSKTQNNTECCRFRHALQTVLITMCIPLFVLPAFAAPAVSPMNFLLLRDKGPFTDPARCVTTVDNPRYLGAGDLNGDGTIDFVAVPSDDTNNIAVHLINSFGIVQSRTLINVGAPSEHIHVADISNDGNLDLLVVHDNQDLTGGFSVILGDGTGNFSSATPVPNTNHGDARRIITGDFIPDPPNNYIDVALGIKTNSTPDIWRLWIMQNDGGPNFGSFTFRSEFEANVVTGLDTADIDGDGDLDLLTTVVLGDAPPDLTGRVIVNVGLDTGNLPFFESNDPYDVHYNPVQGRFADVNDDNILDIVVGGAGEDASLDNPPVSDNVTYIKGEGDGTFTDIVSTQTKAYKSRGFAAADFDGDGKIDIATTSRGANEIPPAAGQDVRVLFGNGTGSFDNTDENMLIYDDYWYATGIIAEDIDGDDDKDIIFTIGGNNVVGPDVLHDSVCVLRNNIPQ